MNPNRFKRRLNQNVGYLIVVFVLAFYGILSAQSNTDSLLTILRSKKLKEEQKLELFSLIAKEYNKTGNDSADYYAKSALRLAEASDNINFIISNLVIIGSEAVKQDSLIKAKGIYLRAVELTEKATDSHAVLSVWIMLGYINDILGDYEKALGYYFKGLNIAESLGKRNFVSRFDNNIGNIYGSAGEYRKAIEYYLKAAGIFKEMNEDSFYANTLLNIGNDYYNLEMVDSAWYYLNKSKEINEKLNNHYGLVNYYNKLSEIEYDEGNYRKALEFIKIELKEIEQLDKSFFGSNAYNRAGALLFLGDIYFKLNENEKALKSYQDAKYIAKKSSFLKYIAVASKGLSEVYEKMGQIDSALIYYKSFHKLSDSAKNMENSKRIAELEMDFRLQKERRQLKLEKERMEAAQKIKGLIYLSITGAAITALLIFIMLFIHHRNKHKQSILKERNLQLEKDNLMKELELKNKELTTNVLYLLKKNEFIADISGKLKNIDSKSGSFKSSDIVDIVRELDRNTSGEIWREFEKRFKDVYGDFYERLTIRFPDLTPNELKLSAFLKLNMSTKEISSITYQTPETLKTARHRLRKKLGLTREDNLVAFLNQI